MGTYKSIDINNLTTNSFGTSVTTAPVNTWLNIKDINNDGDFSDELAAICSQHEQQKKWVLVVGHENKKLLRLQKEQQIDASKLLCIHSNKVHVNIKNIEKALSTGNCSAVVLCDTQINDEEINTLSQHAQLGSTQCILLNHVTNEVSNNYLH